MNILGIGFNLFSINFPLFCELQDFALAKIHYRMLPSAQEKTVDVHYKSVRISFLAQCVV
jgi:hypothetical protein